MFPGLRCPSRRPVADYRFVFGHCHVRAVALEGEAAFHISLRFVLRFRAGGRDGRGSRTSTSALPGSLTVISVVPKPSKTCARGRRRRGPSEAEGRRGRARILTEVSTPASASTRRLSPKTLRTTRPRRDAPISLSDVRLSWAALSRGRRRRAASPRGVLPCQR